MNPSLQTQVYDPLPSEHVAFSWQPLSFLQFMISVKKVENELKNATKSPKNYVGKFSIKTVFIYTFIFEN